MIFPEKPQILYAPMLATFGGGSANGFRSSGGGSSAPYPFSFTANSTNRTSYTYFRDTASTGVSNVNGYEFPNLAPTITGNASGYVTQTSAISLGSCYFGRMSVTSAQVALLGVQTMTVKGCRGGKHNSQYANNSPNNVQGGKGSSLTVEIDFPAMYAAMGVGVSLHVYFMCGLRGPDISTGTSGQAFPGTGGGGASVVAVYNGSTMIPMIVAGGGGGAYHTDQATPYQRPGLNAFVPSVSNISTFEQWNTYPHGVNDAYPLNGSGIGSSDRPWTHTVSGTGAGSGASWAHVSKTYSAANSFHGELPSLRDSMLAIVQSGPPYPWNINNPTNQDAHTNGAIYGGFAGGGTGAYGGGGGAGYFGGYCGHYNNDSNNTYGRARGGQSYYDPTYCTFVSHGSSSNNFGQVIISA